jgi:hypothetical protein
MPSSFTYGATVVNFSQNPQLGDWKITKKWLSPKTRTAGRGNSFVSDKGSVMTFHTLHWPMLQSADMTALIAFLGGVHLTDESGNRLTDESGNHLIINTTSVDGISNAFDYTDPATDIWSARIWNAAELKASLVFYQRTEITIELMIFGSHSTDESGDRLTDESGNHLITDA